MMIAPEYLDLDEWVRPLLFWGGLIVFFVATSIIIILWVIEWAKESWKKTASLFVIVVCAITVVGFSATYFSPLGDIDAREDSLPGLSTTAGMKIYNLAVDRRQYILRLATPEGAQASLYFSRNNAFTFSLTDLHGENHTLELPIGRRGIPFDTFIIITCEVGETSTSAYLRVLKNGREMKRVDIPSGINLGSKNWSQHKMGDDDNYGRKNYCATAWAIGHVTLSKIDYRNLANRIRVLYQQTQNCV
jgi:hypothetical protein